MTDQQQGRVPRWFDDFIQPLIESEDHEVTMEPAEDYGWLIYVDGENVTPAGPDQGLPWESLTLTDDWDSHLTDEERDRVRRLAQEDSSC